MSNINQTQDLFALDTVQDLDNETAAACSGGIAYLHNSDPDVVLYDDQNGYGRAVHANASPGDGYRNIGFNNRSETGFNDKTSSIWIRRGTWNFFQDSHFRGESTGLLRPGFYNLGHNDNKITSFFRTNP